MPASQLFAREATCAAGQVACSSSDLPNSFCCPSETTCNVLAGGSTVLCCPTGRNCDKIQPITCNVGEQDVEKHPDAPIKTTVLNVELEKCGEDTCCPFGYTCSTSGGTSQCIANSDQSSLPKAAESHSSSTAAPSATTTSKSSTHPETASATPVPTGTIPGKATEPGPDDANADSSESKSNKGPEKTSIIGGVVGSALLLLCIVIIVYLCIRRRNRRRDVTHGEKSGHIYGSGDSASSLGSFGNIISEPIVQPGSYRTDFILKTPSSRATSAQRAYVTPVPSIVHQPATTPRRPRTPPRTPPPNDQHMRVSLPNPFDSPSPSPYRKSTSPSSQDERIMRTGNVARLPPIRATRSSFTSRYPTTPELAREPSCESINVFADPADVDTMDPKTKPRLLTRPTTNGTTFTDMMGEAGLSSVRHGGPYVPGTTPKI